MSSVSPQPPVSSLVKICGITQKAQARAIAALGADFLGINFWPQSKRYLSLEKASWLAEIGENVSLTGVFVNPDFSYIEDVAASGYVSAYQLHGDETPEFCAELQERGLNVVKAFQVKDAATLKIIADYPVQDILLDAYHPDERGGLGETFPWQLALEFKRLYPSRNLYLAGGLTAANVAEAVQGVKPYAVDVASGVESGIPGVKDLEKVSSFIQHAKNRTI